jgi:hypothetical protein
MISQAAKAIAGVALPSPIPPPAARTAPVPMPAPPPPVPTPAPVPAPLPIMVAPLPSPTSTAPAARPSQTETPGLRSLEFEHDLPQIHVPPPRHSSDFISDMELPDLDLSSIADGPRIETEPTLRLIVEPEPSNSRWFFWVLAAVAVLGVAAVYTAMRFGWIKF